MTSSDNWRLDGLAIERWEWLKEQPQDTWLMFVRRANWDDCDGIFLEMLADPACDRAVAAWLFWLSAPDYALSEGRYTYCEVTQAVIENYERGFYRKAELHQDRYPLAQFADPVQAVFRQGKATDLFKLPRALCGPFGTRQARVEHPGDTLMEQLDLYVGSDLFLTEEEYDQDELRGNYGYYRQYYDLPEMGPDFEAENADLTDLEYLVAAFGEPRLRSDAHSLWKADKDKSRSTLH